MRTARRSAWAAFVCGMCAIVVVPACAAEEAVGTGGTGGGTPCSNGEPGCQGETEHACTSAASCSGLKDASCSTASCVDGRCAFTFAPKGTPYTTQQAGDCKQQQCDGAGNKEDVPLLSDLPPQVQGDCRKKVCTAQGAPADQPDDGDVPAPAANDCVEPPACASGKIVATPKAAETACTTGGGRFCNGGGKCLYCAPPSATCEDTEPGGASNDTQGTAYNFGSIGLCDSSGSRLCGATRAGDVDWFTYTQNGSGFLCENDPRMTITATASVHACIYATCSGGGAVTCGAGATSVRAPGGQTGCCKDGPNVDIAICAASEVHFSVQPSNGVAVCIGYDFSFHP